MPGKSEKISRTISILARTETFVADIFFPKRCITCGRSGTFFCDTCLDRVPRKRAHTCPACQKVATPDGATCLSCRDRSALDGVFSAATFREDRVVADAIHILKYEYVPDLAEPLGRLVAARLHESDLSVADLVIPVPLHPWRARYRGFNQSEEIARHFLAHFLPELPIPLRSDILHRIRFTLPQARSRSAAERRKNLRGAFSLDASVTKKDLRGKTVWLVDDVATTGTTLEECARVLKKAGVASVHGIIAAR